MPGRLPGVEGLRALAAAAVLLHHVPWVAGTEDLRLAGPIETVFEDLRWGLVLFFALSGFLLFRPFARTILNDAPPPSIRNYARHRALRILPAYWVILLLTIFVVGTAAVWAGDGTGIPSIGVLIADLLLVQNYSTSTVLTGIGPAWSLAVEVVFYVLLPILAIGAARFAARASGPNGRIVAALGAGMLLIVVGIASKVALSAGMFPASWGFVTKTLLPVHADMFGYGMLAAVAHVLHEEGRLEVKARPLLIGAAALTMAMVVLGPKLGIQRSGQLSDSVIGAACGLLLLAVCAKGAGARVLDRRPVVFTGLISYSVYLWHLPLLLWLADHGVTVSGEVSLVGVALLAAALTFALSALTWRFVERPAQRAAKRTTPSTSDSLTASSSASRSRWPRTSLNVR